MFLSSKSEWGFLHYAKNTLSSRNEQNSCQPQIGSFYGQDARTRHNLTGYTTKEWHAEVLSETQFAGMAKIVHTKIVHTKIAQLINFGLLKITNYEIINIMVIQEP